MSADMCRNPTKRRGRPPGLQAEFRKLRSDAGASRNGGDMIMVVMRRLAPELRGELLASVESRKTTMGVVAAVARFKPGDQRRAFEDLSKLGARAAKRYVECLHKPPDEWEVATRILGYVSHEFPLADRALLLAGLRRAAGVVGDQADE